MISDQVISNVLGSIQRALLGHITPNLREVYVVIETEDSYQLFFYYDKELGEEEEELASFADTEFIADFPSPDYKTQCTISILPYPKKIIQEGFCVYQRYEK